MPRRLLPSLLGLLLAAAPAAANDSSGFMGTTGLQLTRSPTIAMESEDLRISPTEVAVDYVFRNRGDQPVTTLVVFPMPEINLAVYPDEANWNLPNRDSANFLDFTVSVDGRAVTPQRESKAMVGDRDVSAVLRQNGLAEFGGWFWGDQVADEIDKLPPASRAALRAAGATKRQFDRDWPAWRLQTRFYWEQSFPPNQALAVAHRYRPFVGQAMLSRAAFPTDSAMARFGGSTGRGQPASQRYCVDAGTARAAANLGQRFRNQPFMATEIEYILTTARNWSGPIGRFRLTMDMGSNDAVLSLCWRGTLRRASPRSFVFEATNWLPDEDIRLAIITPAQ